VVLSRICNVRGYFALALVLVGALVTLGGGLVQKRRPALLALGGVVVLVSMFFSMIQLSILFADSSLNIAILYASDPLTIIEIIAILMIFISSYRAHTFIVKQNKMLLEERRLALAREDAMAQQRELENVRLRAQREREDKIAQADRYAKAERFEWAAQLYESLGMWEKAGESRRMNRTNYLVAANINIEKGGGIQMNCPHCGASPPIKVKETNQVTCAYCNSTYFIPEKILKML
jgi:hypothetical protein